MSTGAATVTGMLVLLALVVVVWLLMLHGWRARTARQEGDGPGQLALPPPAEVAGGFLPRPVEGVYVSTTLAGQPLERVAAHGLGTRSTVQVGVEGSTVGAGASLVLLRGGARSVRIPRADLLGVRRASGMVGKFTFGKEGLVVITWRLGGTEVDTGVRASRRTEAGRLVELVEGLLAAPGPAAGAA